MQTKPLINLGECMPPSLQNSNTIPDLSSKCIKVGQTSNGSIVVPMTATHVHKIVYILAKVANSLHRDDIASRTEIPLSSVSTSLAKLKQARVIISPDCGYYMLTTDFLRQFQLTFGAAKTGRLLKMFDDGDIDHSVFEIALNDEPPAPNKASMLDTVRAYMDAQSNRLATISTEIEKLTEEKNAIATELAGFGQLANLALAA